MSDFIHTANNNKLQKNVTLQNIIQLHDYIVHDLDSIYQGGFGDIFDLDISTNQIFPVAFLTLESANYQINELQYDFRLYVMDLVGIHKSKEEYRNVSNENDVLSDTLQIVGDYLSVLRHGDKSSLTNVQDFDLEYGFRVSDDVTCEPFTERFDSQVSGWAANFTITVSFGRGACTGLI